MAVVRLLRVVVLAGWMQLLLGSCPPGQFGDSCSYSCNCGTSCNETTGACSGDCDTGWRKAGGLCQKQNIALNKAASTTSGQYSNWSPSKAVDGDRDINGEGRTCFHAGRSQSDWTVDLGRDYQLYDIRIYSRRNYYWRNANSNIYLNNNSSAICSTLPSPSSTPNPTDVTCNGTGRYLTIRNPGTGPAHSDALTICEVEIYVCSPGIYGVNCNTSCHCLDSTCDRLTGFCPGGCRPGWQGQRCDTACNNTSYGTNCNKSCAERKCAATNSSCDHHTGACDTGCLPGWIDEVCTQECVKGTYGTNCISFCPDRHCAGNSSCNHVTGSCDLGCDSGWMGADCKDECDSQHYGSNCLGVCFSRHCVGNSLCNSTGVCDSGCETGWTLADCTECDSQHYGSNCLGVCFSRHCVGNSLCNSTGVCDSGCETGWTLADCTECKPGTFGPDCSRCGHCDVTCNDGDGRCPGECLDGFIGDRCDIDVRVSPVTSGVIGGALVMAVMLCLNTGLMIFLWKSGRLKRTPLTGTPPTEVRETNTGDTGEIPAPALSPGMNGDDYTELNEVTREREQSLYDVIQNNVYENN
ncbi:multiple epidermal growth factor-like domains protein 11 [Haliotis rufescens]|uniref:multiple epidermal growth factor-like domains protein 11 n=1 Tax=Haliotis rufescens TaxID=6454 RepID=UPI001EAFDC6A|nr:multiple epidermal growth factor-like domains protein 11 [Haliotis rufescens]